MRPFQYDWCLNKKKLGCQHAYIQRKHHASRKMKTGAMLLQSKKNQRCQQNSSEAKGETLNEFLEFQPQKLWYNKYALVKPSSLW